MTKKRIAILILVFLSTFPIVFSFFFIETADVECEKSKFYFEVRFDAHIISGNLYGKTRNTDGTSGKEVNIPIQTKVHVIALKKSGYILVDIPDMIEIDGESYEVTLDYIPIESIDKSSYAKELLQSEIQENEQSVDLKNRNYFFISILVAVVLFSVFSWIILFIEKKCTSKRKYKILFFCLLSSAILSLLCVCVLYNYLGHMH